MTAIDLAGRHALVTGGARGLGTAMAQALADSGASVVIADLLDEEGTASAKTLSDNGTKAAFVHLDVTDDDNWAIAVE
jgi:NAD(P)-dependent dehydrogenase (short-subunit alcohol dehydrogenase family)